MTSGLVIVGLRTATLPESADAANTCPSGDHQSGNDCVANSERSTPIIPNSGACPSGSHPQDAGLGLIVTRAAGGQFLHGGHHGKVSHR